MHHVSAIGVRNPAILGVVATAAALACALASANPLTVVVSAAGLVGLTTLVLALLLNVRWAFNLLMFSLPFAALRVAPIRGLSNLAFIAVVILFFSLLLNLRRLPPLRLGVYGAKPWLMAAVLGLALPGLLFAANQGSALKHATLLFIVISLYAASTLLLRDLREWSQASHSFLAGTLASALIILYDFLAVLHPGQSNFYRAGSLFAGGPASGTVICLLLAVPQALNLLDRERRWCLCAFYYAAALCSAAAILFSATRSAWLALALLAVIELLRRPGRTLVALGLAAALTACLVRVYLPSSYLQSYAIRIFVALNPEYGPQAQVGFRIENYEVGLRMLANYPVVGVGMHNFAAHAGNFGRTKVPLETNLNAHNAFLEMLTGTGLIGGLAYLLVWLLTLHEFTRVAMRGPPAMRPLASGLALGLLLLAVHSMFHSSAYVALLLAPVFAFGSAMRAHAKGAGTIAETPAALRA